MHESTEGGQPDVVRPPASLEAAGLSQNLVIDLVLRHLSRGGEASIAELGSRIALPLPILDRLLTFMRSERVVEVPRRGSFDADVRYALTDAGRVRADDAMRRNQYIGPAPGVASRTTSPACSARRCWTQR